MSVTDPISDQEWQEAVDAAQFYLLLDSCRQYGLITGGPAVSAERCEQILKFGKTRGFRPAPTEDLVRRFIPGARQ